MKIALCVVGLVICVVAFLYSLFRVEERAEDQSEETFNQLNAERERHASVERFMGRPKR